MHDFWKTFYRYKAHHVLLWLCYYLFWIFFYYRVYNSVFNLIIIISIYVVFIGGAFYFTAYFLFPRFLYKRKYGMFVMLFLLTVTCCSILLGICLHAALREFVPEAARDLSGFFQIAFLSLSTMVGALCAVKLTLDKIRTDNTNQKLEKQRLETELQYLKAQVNPHFLFNAINSVYFLIKKDPEQASETLIKLSDLLRFQLYDCSEDQIPIEKEMDYLMNFVALEKIRRGDRLNIDLVIDEDVCGFMIAPFMLIPFLENSFKHVSARSDGENKISIHFSKEGSVFTAAFFNTCDNVKREEVGGLGIKNVQRRLELLYPGKHVLLMEQKQQSFLVTLSLDLYER